MSTTHDHRQSHADSITAPQINFEAEHDPGVSRRASNAQLGAIQMKIGGQASEGVHDAAARGVSSPETAMPFADKIQQSFGEQHDISNIRAHVGGDSAKSMGANAYATGNHVVFDRSPDLHTAAHEAAHVVQQAKGVNLYGGVGEAGDSYEKHADAVADRVVSGQSASDLLGTSPSHVAGGSNAVQRKEASDTSNSEAHDRADASSGDAFSLKVDLLAVRMRSATHRIDELRMSPSNSEAGIYPAIQMINDEIDHVTGSAEDLFRAASLTKSQSGAVKSVQHTDLAILVGSWGAFRDAVNRARNWGAKDGIEANPDRIHYWLNSTLGMFDMSLENSAPIFKNERIDDKSVEDLENEDIAASIGAIHACAAAVKKNYTSSSDDEIKGDVYKLLQAVHEVKELITTTGIATRIKGTSGLKKALAEIYDIERELQTKEPGLAKSFESSTLHYDLRVLGDFVKTHKPLKAYQAK